MRCLSQWNIMLATKHGSSELYETMWKTASGEHVRRFLIRSLDISAELPPGTSYLSTHLWSGFASSPGLALQIMGSLAPSPCCQDCPQAQQPAASWISSTALVS